jgi:hypothetical protein
MSAKDTQAKVLRPSQVVASILFVIGIILGGIGGWRLQKSPSFSVAQLLLILGALSVVAAVQHSMTRIILLPDRLEFGGLLGRTSIPREEIESGGQMARHVYWREVTSTFTEFVARIGL